MRRRQPQAPKQVSASYNYTAAFAKAGTAPLKTLTDQMVESIAASHARRGTPQFDKLLRDLRDVVANRRAMEAAA